jgi:hypothetical protein
MDLKPSHRRKISRSLRSALEHAQAGTPLRVILSLGDDEDEFEAGASVTPGEFPSRTDYRREAIARRSKDLDRRFGPTLDALRSLNLEVQGGRALRTVVVEGPAEGIAASLDWPEVREARLDEPIELIRPHRAT